MALDEEQHATVAASGDAGTRVRQGTDGYTNHVEEYAEDITGGLSPEREGGANVYTAGRADRTP